MTVTVFRNERIVDPSRGIDETGSVVVDGKKIAAAGASAHNQGAPEGDPTAAPPALVWPAGGWQIKPDVSVDLPPYPVPARGIAERHQALCGVECDHL